MRHGRAKLARKTLQFYRLNTKSIHSPYKILVDGTFLVASIRQKVPLKERFEKTLQHESFMFYIARSTLDELLSLIRSIKEKREESGGGGGGVNEETLEALEKARQFGLDECEIIEPSSLPNSSSSSSKKKDKDDDDKNEKNEEEKKNNASKDIQTLTTVNNSNDLGYFVATQDEQLSDTLRSFPYVPLFRLGRGVLLLEGPSSASRSFASRLERDKEKMGGSIGITEEERSAVQKAKERERVLARRKAEKEKEAIRAASNAELGGFAIQDRRKRGKSRAKEPNPLSCKKRKGVGVDGSSSSGGGDCSKKKRRRKNKMKADA